MPFLSLSISASIRFEDTKAISMPEKKAESIIVMMIPATRDKSIFNALKFFLYRRRPLHSGFESRRKIGLSLFSAVSLLRLPHRVAWIGLA